MASGVTMSTKRDDIAAVLLIERYPRCRSGSRPRGVGQHVSLAAVDAAPRRTPPVASRHLGFHLGQHMISYSP